MARVRGEEGSPGVVDDAEHARSSIGLDSGEAVPFGRERDVVEVRRVSELLLARAGEGEAMTVTEGAPQGSRAEGGSGKWSFPFAALSSEEGGIKEHTMGGVSVCSEPV